MAEPNRVPSIKSNVAEAARAVTRPIVTILFATALIAGEFEGIDFSEWFVYGLAMPCILSWFGERAVTRIREKKGGNNNAQA